VRCFIALTLPPSVLDALAALEESMRQRLRGPRWAGTGSHHVTLAFLGDVNDSGRDCAYHAARAMAALRPLKARFGPPGGFPPRGPYKVLVLPLDDAEPGGPGDEEEGAGRLHGAWVRLNEALRSAELRHGIEHLNEEYPSGKPFKPHVTLARARLEPVGRKAWDACAPLAEGIAEAAFEISACTVYESRLGREGAEYHPLETVKFSGSEA
jgi:2'-5' RNA ligase